MKKIYLIFLLLSCFSLVLISFINSKKDALIYTENSNNLKKLIDDSIKPHCSNNLNTSYKNLINPYKEFIINIPNSRKWSRNLYKAYVQNSSVITENYKKDLMHLLISKNLKMRHVNYLQELGFLEI